MRRLGTSLQVLLFSGSPTTLCGCDYWEGGFCIYFIVYLRLVSDFVLRDLPWPAASDCSHKVSFVHRIFVAEYLCGNGSVQRRQLLVKNCTVPQENVLKVLLPLDLIPVIYPAVQNTFPCPTVTGSLGKFPHLTVPCG